MPCCDPRGCCVVALSGAPVGQWSIRIRKRCGGHRTTLSPRCCGRVLRRGSLRCLRYFPMLAQLDLEYSRRYAEWRAGLPFHPPTARARVRADPLSRCPRRKHPQARSPCVSLQLSTRQRPRSILSCRKNIGNRCRGAESWSARRLSHAPSAGERREPQLEDPTQILFCAILRNADRYSIHPLSFFQRITARVTQSVDLFKRAPLPLIWKRTPSLRGSSARRDLRLYSRVTRIASPVPDRICVYLHAAPTLIERVRAGRRLRKKHSRSILIGLPKLYPLFLSYHRTASSQFRSHELRRVADYLCPLMYSLIGMRGPREFFNLGAEAVGLCPRITGPSARQIPTPMRNAHHLHNCALGNRITPPCSDASLASCRAACFRRLLS